MPYAELRKGRISQSGRVYHVTTVTRKRIPYFNALANGRKVVQQSMALQEQGTTETLCYVLMPDHLHWLMVLHKGTLSNVMQLLKGRSARIIGEPIWQPNYYDHAVRQEEDRRKIARYIVANPLRANLVSQIGDYSLWDAVWLEQALSG
ncbi:MAG: transposase [Methylobacter sp.]|nr:transposase [Methylobacter sp.]